MAVPNERYPSSLIASDLRMLIGMGFVASAEPSRYYAGRGKDSPTHPIATSNQQATPTWCRHAVFELAPLTPTNEREIYMVCGEKRQREHKPIGSMELVITRIERLPNISHDLTAPRPPPITVRGGRPSVAYGAVGYGSDAGENAYEIYRDRKDAWLVLRRLRPLAAPLMCTVPLFEHPEDDSPVLVLNDENGDRAVIAIGNLAPPGERIEVFPDAPPEHKPSWFGVMKVASDLAATLEPCGVVGV